MPTQSSFSFKLAPAQQDALERILRGGNYRLRDVPHARVAAEKEGTQIVLYTSGSCVVQGKGAQDWVTFTMEPEVLGEARIGYDEVLDPDRFTPHMGVDESGKGDFFGPLVISAAYVDEQIVPQLQALNVRDSKRITSDRVAEDLAKEIRRVLGDRFSVVTIGPRAYNRLYATMRNVNRILSWGHARAIENVLDRVPTCPRAISDQFGPRQQILKALLEKGRKIDLITRTKAESDPAVAAASILARAAFLKSIRDIGTQHGVTIPKGASAAVRSAAESIVRTKGPTVLLDIAKCHFKTTDEVLAAAGADRSSLGAEGARRLEAVRRKAPEVMKLVRYGEPGRERPGLWLDGPEPSILDVRAMAFDIDDYNEHFFTHWGIERLRGLLAEPGPKRVPATGIRLGPPVPPPRNLVCVGKNYAAHAKEFDAAIPAAPILFAKSPGALAGPHDTIRIPPGFTQVDAEAELAVVLGRELFDAGEDEALRAIAGVMALNDVTERAAQREAGQWYRGKSFDTFCPAGPWLVTRDDVPDLQSLRVRSTLNGAPMQDGSTADMLFGVAALLAYASRTMRLLPGDILATGTPDGVGFARTPPVFLQPGDTIEVHIDRIGALRNPVAPR